ncbi:hypothetical protein TrispH2_010487, partial [Trichoplax sp. H2]
MTLEIDRHHSQSKLLSFRLEILVSKNVHTAKVFAIPLQRLKQKHKGLEGNSIQSNNIHQSINQMTSVESVGVNLQYRFHTKFLSVRMCTRQKYLRYLYSASTEAQLARWKFNPIQQHQSINKSNDISRKCRSQPTVSISYKISIVVATTDHFPTQVGGHTSSMRRWRSLLDGSIPRKRQK